MLDKVLAVLSLGCLVGFMALVVYYIAEPDLTIITAIVLIMAVYDFFILNTGTPSSRAEQDHPDR